jgi:SAM-dependent methyltransferase
MVRREGARLLNLRADVHEQLGELVVCPICKTEMDWQADQIRCFQCARQFRILDGIPVVLIDEQLSSHDELEHDHKANQSAYFDRGELAEFEIHRPRHTARLYRWLLQEKFRRSMSGVEPLLPGALALTVCGGSGMDADFLAQRGAHVIASDISLGAARRCRERSRRYGLAIIPIVADVECLPFRDKSIDLVYVHDGLHHLRRPMAGLAEMTRVASRGISITEPAEALLTTVAVRLGLAKEYEEAGNRVCRLRATDLKRALDSLGFDVVHTERYAMYYPHQPGRMFAMLSRPTVFQLVTWLWRLANFVSGRFGNKLAVSAVPRWSEGTYNSGA